MDKEAEPENAAGPLFRPPVRGERSKRLHRRRGTPCLPSGRQLRECPAGRLGWSSTGTAPCWDGKRQATSARESRTIWTGKRRMFPYVEPPLLDGHGRQPWPYRPGGFRRIPCQPVRQLERGRGLQSGSRQPAAEPERKSRRYDGILSVFSHMFSGTVPSPERCRFFAVFPITRPFPFTASGGACPDAAQQKQALPALFLHQTFFV